MSNPVRTYIGLYAHAAKLTVRALGRFWPYLFVAPVVSLAYFLVSNAIFQMTGPLGGLVVALIRAAAVSAVLFAVRGIIEQRKLSVDELTRGMGAFFGDVLTVFFALWIVSMLAGIALGPLASALLFLAVLLLPVAETVALTTTGGFPVFQEAWRFFQRDWAAWLGGHLFLAPVLLLWAMWGTLVPSAHRLLPFLPFQVAQAVGLVLFHLSAALLMIALVFRGILFLTLDNTSPRARAERFGGATSLR